MAYPSNRQPTVSSDSVAQDQIRAFVERVERLNEERKAIADDIKEVYAEARGNGFDIKALKIVIREREKDPEELHELEAIVGLYKAALGMAAAPLDDDDFEPVSHTRAPAPARTREIIEEFPPHDSETGVIIEDNEPADREHITGSVGKEFPNNEPAPPATPEESGGPSAGEGAGVALPADTNSDDEDARDHAEHEALYAQAVEIVRAENKGSPSLIQRKLAIGYNKAMVLIERMERDGIVTKANHAGLRQVINSPVTNSERDHGEAGAIPASAGAPAATGTAHNPIPVAVPPSHDGLYSYDWLRRHGRCLAGDGCEPKAGKVCITCSRAMAVVPATAQIPHEGSVA